MSILQIFNLFCFFQLKMVLRKKAAIYERFDTEVKVPPVFYLQIWDNDVFSPDDFLGVVNVNLSHFKEPVTTAKKCSLRQQTKYVNLFNVGTVKGWFPAEGKFSDGSIGLTVYSHYSLLFPFKTSAIGYLFHTLSKHF